MACDECNGFWVCDDTEDPCGAAGQWKELGIFEPDRLGKWMVSEWGHKVKLEYVGKKEPDSPQA